MRGSRSIVFSLAMLLSTLSLQAQIQGASGHNVIMLNAGYTNVRPSGINSLVDLGFEGFSQLHTIGIGLNATVLNRGSSNWDGAWAVNFFLPYKVEANPGHTGWSLRGWELMTSLLGFDLLRSVDAIDFTVAPGVFWGNLKLKDGDRLYKNPFVAPMARAELRFNIRKITVGGRVSYRYDLTDSKWKRRDENLPVLPGYHFREVQFMTFIGWQFEERK